MPRQTPQQVQAVIFDLGGVITAPPWPLLTAYADEIGLAGEVLKRSMVHGAPALAEAELGTISTERFFETVCSHVLSSHNVAVDPERIACCIRDSLAPVPEMLQLLTEVRREHQIAILTNNTRELAAVWRPAVDGQVDLIIDSWEVGLRKPESSIYHLTLQRLGCAAPDAVFVDDHPDNVAGAREVGMRAILFDNPGQLRDELVNCGVKLDVPSSCPAEL